MSLHIANGANNFFIPEDEQIISQLERGTVVTKFYPRKRPERRTMMVRRETRQIIWSRDFDKWPEECRRIEILKCLIIFYGSEFKLKTLSVIALSEKECELWVKGLKFLVPDTMTSPYPLQVERWLRREFYAMENAREMVSLKEVKVFLPRISCKMPTNKLREIFQEVDTRKRMELGFDDFSILYHKLMFPDEVSFREVFEPFNPYSENRRTVTLQEFQCFLVTEQRDPMGNDERLVSQFMRDYIEDPQRDFMDFLYSKQNEIWDRRFDAVYQDMTRPLSHYWIASSHNT
ncbi:hypothetical protein B566_EDAN004350 [Ephemera danica]|nr:hypothetical protein B566_EDAN004350 [Ephemera danica]